MADDEDRPVMDDALSLEARAAWFYHIGGLTQSEVAKKLNLSSGKVHRLIVRAGEAGLVRITVQARIGECIPLETELAERFGLAECRVVPALDDNGVPFRAIGAQAASMLLAALESGLHHVIGIGHGRSLASMVAQLPRLPVTTGVSIVSLLGGVPRQRYTTSFNVIYQLAEKTGADAWVMPVPFIANTAEDAVTLRTQSGIAEAISLATESTLSFVGIGEVIGNAILPSSEVIGKADVQALRALGAVGEVLGHYYDLDGRPITSELTKRIVSVDPSLLAGKGLIAVASGETKIDAILAILRSGSLSGLITDEPSAKRILSTS